ncbi:MAG: rhodanese-like domain-containing protein [Halarcobacter sp.]
MKQLLIGFVALIAILFGIFNIVSTEEEPIRIHNEQLSKTFISQKVPIIDIRTKDEWKRTGIVEDSILMTFYEPDGRFNEESFLRNLNSKFDKKSEFAILCRSGNRSNRVTRFLVSKGYQNVINLAGGIKQGIKNGVQFKHL